MKNILYFKSIKILKNFIITYIVYHTGITTNTMQDLLKK